MVRQSRGDRYATASVGIVSLLVLAHSATWVTTMAKITPSEFATKYLELDVFLYPQELSAAALEQPGYTPPQGWNRVCVDNYRLGASAWREKFWNENIKSHFRGDPFEIRVKTLEEEYETMPVMPESEAWGHYRFPFVGKGSPEQVQIAIQFVYRFRRVVTPVEQFVAAPHGFVGLDCNGFVGNYIQRVVRNLKWREAKITDPHGPDSNMTALYTIPDLTTEITNVSELRREDTYILVMCSEVGMIINAAKATATHDTVYGHIMLTDPGTLKETAAGLTVEIAEATASGGQKLRKNYTYTIQKQTDQDRKRKMFHVVRGADRTMPVRIARLKVE